MPTITDLPKNYDELDFIELEISRIRAYYRHQKEHEAKIDEFCKKHKISGLRQFDYSEASYSDRKEYETLAYHGPRTTNAYVMRSLQNIRELSLEYGKGVRHE